MPLQEYRQALPVFWQCLPVFGKACHFSDKPYRFFYEASVNLASPQVGFGSG